MLLKGPLYMCSCLIEWRREQSSIKTEFLISATMFPHGKSLTCHYYTGKNSCRREVGGRGESQDQHCSYKMLQRQEESDQQRSALQWADPTLTGFTSETLTLLSERVSSRFSVSLLVSSVPTASSTHSLRIRPRHSWRSGNFCELRAKLETYSSDSTVGENLLTAVKPLRLWKCA